MAQKATKRGPKSFARSAAAVNENSTAIPTPFTTAPALLQPLLPQLDPSKVHLIHIDRHTPQHKKQIVRPAQTKPSTRPPQGNPPANPNSPQTVPHSPPPEHSRRPRPPLPPPHRPANLYKPHRNPARQRLEPHNPGPKHHNAARSPHRPSNALPNLPLRLPAPPPARAVALRLLPRVAQQPLRLALVAGRLPARRSDRAREPELGRARAAAGRGGGRRE